MTSVVINPKTITIGDASISAQSVTSFNVLVGTVSGGPYTTLSGTLPNASLTDSATGASGPFADIAWGATPPANFTTYYLVVQAVNAQGASGDSPEVGFLLATAPSAPTSLALA